VILPIAVIVLAIILENFILAGILVVMVIVLEISKVLQRHDRNHLARRLKVGFLLLIFTLAIIVVTANQVSASPPDYKGEYYTGPVTSDKSLTKEQRSNLERFNARQDTLRPYAKACSTGSGTFMLGASRGFNPYSILYGGIVGCPAGILWKSM
jgi:energy-coupling factor transporter transmembrane protein EcfT